MTITSYLIAWREGGMVFENVMVTHDVNIIAVSVRKNCSFQSQFEGNLSFQLSEIKVTPTILQEDSEKKSDREKM